MPAIASIQTTVICDKLTLSSILDKYQQILEQIDCAPPHVQKWLSQIKWPSWQTGYSVDFPSVTLLPGKEDFSARTFLSFNISETEDDWNNEVELGLFLEEEPLCISYDSLEYQPIVGNLVWDILKVFALTFPETGVYFVNEGQDTHAWEVLHAKKNNFWLLDATIVPAPSLDLAILPLELVQRFQPIPERMFELVYFNGFVGLAAKYCFSIPPWETSFQSE